jgi:surfeit locus 1 family protein
MTTVLAVLLGLGTWQVQRLQWKLGVLTQLAHAEAAPPVPLPADPTPYSKVVVAGHLRSDLATLYGAEVRDTTTGPELGGQWIVPLERPDGDVILVDRGWVPDRRTRPLDLPDGSVSVTGFVRPGDTPGMFSARDDVAGRRFYTLDPAAIGAALGLQHVAPFVLVAMGPTPPLGYPDPAQHLPQPPNNHLSYAITWYGLAVALMVMFLLWARKVLST